MLSETLVNPTASLLQRDVAPKLLRETTKSSNNQAVSQVLLNKVNLITNNTLRR
jgi:hypothetical protein